MKFIDLTGKRFGRLIVNKYIGKNKWGISLWLCKCDCGKEKIISSHNLKSGDIQSCGCFKIEINKTKRDNWKKEEVDILKKFYSEKGAIWCADKLKRPLCRVKHKIRYFDLHTKNRNGKSPIEIIYKIDETTAIASCPKHGICRHYKKKKNNNLTCCICLGLSQKERNKTEEGRVKQRERSRKWRKNPVNRFAANLRKRLREGLNRIYNKNAKYKFGTFRFLPYAPLDLFNHLENIRKLQNDECPCCKISYDKCKMSIDHIIPVIKAKTEQEVINLFDLKNLSLLCKDCNSSKNDNSFQEWNKRKDIFNNCVLDSGIVVG